MYLSIFSYFRSIEHVRETIDFPPYEAFYSDLKRSNVPREEYESCKALYNQRKALQDDHPDKMKNMSCWLRYYNLIDVRPLVTAFENMVKSYSDYFNCDPHIKASLPGLAFDAVCNMSPKNIPLVYTFSNEEIHRLFKKNVLGGICNVYHKLIVLDQGENWPRNARFAPNGDPFTSTLFCDINAMYGDSLRKPMPTTPGLS